MIYHTSQLWLVSIVNKGLACSTTSGRAIISDMLLKKSGFCIIPAIYNPISVCMGLQPAGQSLTALGSFMLFIPCMFANGLKPANPCHHAYRVSETMPLGHHIAV
jgi:hypothetical protein